MDGKVNPIPEGFHTVTPYVTVKGAATAIGFYKEAFGAREIFRWADPDGRIRHAEVVIGDSPIMLTDEAAAKPFSAGDVSQDLKPEA